MVDVSAYTEEEIVGVGIVGLGLVEIHRIENNVPETAPLCYPVGEKGIYEKSEVQTMV